MKTVVIYDSVYGNTKRIAEEIARSIAQEMDEPSPSEVPALHVGQVSIPVLNSAELLVVGSPTHGALPTEAMKAFVKRLGAPAEDSPRVATFDTRLSWGFLRKYGFAATAMADELEEKGWVLQDNPGGFYVRGLKKGPLKKGEVERAAVWAKDLIA
jgi:flavodoxin